MESKGISLVILGRDSDSTRMMYHSLKKDFEIKGVIIERPVSVVHFIYRRIKKLGLIKVTGQIFFQAFIVPLLKSISKKRTRQIKEQFGLNDREIDGGKVRRVRSVNEPPTVDLLRAANPHFVVISGTRIISGKVLDAIPAKFINVHAGITPLYRGVHGAYWALVNDDRKNCGVTVHFVDTGIDTGRILMQVRIEPAKEDNFVTYPVLQLAKGLELLRKCLMQAANSEMKEAAVPEGKSKLWLHPTLLEYGRNYFEKGVR